MFSYTVYSVCIFFFGNSFIREGSRVIGRGAQCPRCTPMPARKEEKYARVTYCKRRSTGNPANLWPEGVFPCPGTPALDQEICVYETWSPLRTGRKPPQTHNRTTASTTRTTRSTARNHQVPPPRGGPRPPVITSRRQLPPGELPPLAS